MSNLRSRVPRSAVAVAAGMLLLSGCAGQPAPHPAASPAPSVTATSQPGADGTPSAQSVSASRDVDGSTGLWLVASRYAPASSPFAQARAACVRRVSLWMPSERRLPVVCVPPYIWRFLPTPDDASTG